MAETLSIKRRKTTDDELSFDSLRSEAIELLQQVSGKTWTDYNLHDPGVTILEQLIYALTDLIYRSEFAVEDYFADADGSIEFETQHLHMPDKIFPCRPATPLDYRKLLLDAVPRADNVWFSPKPAPKTRAGSGSESDTDCYSGLYSLLVKFPVYLKDDDKQEVEKRNLYTTFHAARNLCEDLDFRDIKVVKTRECELHAEIEVGSARLPADLLAEVYFACARRIASGVAITNYDQLTDQKQPLDQLFDGPFTRHGIFEVDDAEDSHSGVPDSTLFATINSIEGVDHVRHLYLDPPAIDNPGDPEDATGAANPVDPGDSDIAFDLYIPKLTAEVKVSLTTNGRLVPFEINEVRARFDELRFKYYASRSSEQAQDPSLLYEPIKGVSRALSQYFSIQNHFPVNYGVNPQGVPASADLDVKARARQLKAYLLIFEQLMANFLANVGAIKTLFSTTADNGVTYSLQTLNQHQVDDLSAVYPQDAEQEFGRILNGFDSYYKRKSRLLDYLLAMYGERFSQNSLRHFNFYYGKDEIEAVILANKIRYLEAIVALGRDRAAAPDYINKNNINKNNGGNRSGLAIRASMLLGFEQRESNSLTSAIDLQGFKLCPHLEYKELFTGRDDSLLTDIDGLRNSHYDQPIELAAIQPTGQISYASLSAGIKSTQDNLLSDDLLGRGISMERYRISASARDQGFRLLLEAGDKQYWKLGDFQEEQDAINTASSLRRMLLKLNRNSEGLHIIEHLLLRPTSGTRDEAQAEDNYAFRISVVFPGWTARCTDMHFRNLAEETLRLNAPAHILPQFLWLNYADMVRFEELNDAWWRLKTDQQAVSVDLDGCARRLLDFLLADHENRQHEDPKSTR